MSSYGQSYGGSADEVPGRAPTPILVVTDPVQLRGQSFALGKAEQRVGRAEECDIRVDDPGVSRCHAVIRRVGGEVIVEDAGSTNGVVVNKARVNGSAGLRSGDRIRLGGIEFAFVGGAGEPGASPADDRTAVRPVAQESRFELGSQHAGVISNVGGNQYNEYALRIAPMLRRARITMRLGLAALLCGFGLFAVGFARFSSPILGCANNPDPSTCGHLDTGGWALAAAGTLLAALGVIVIVTSLVMRRSARREGDRL